MTHKRERGRFWWRRVTLGAVLAVTVTAAAAQQQAFQQPDSGERTIRREQSQRASRSLTSRSDDLRPWRASTMEQELSRPYVYVSRYQDPSTPAGFTLISVKDPAHAKVLYTYHIANPELHLGFGGMEGKTFKYHGRYYYVQCFQFNQGSPGRGSRRDRL